MLRLAAKDGFLQEDEAPGVFLGEKAVDEKKVDPFAMLVCSCLVGAFLPGAIMFGKMWSPFIFPFARSQEEEKEKE